MKEFFRDVFEYHRHFNALLIGEVELHMASLPDRTYPLVCHFLNAGHIWNSRISSMPGMDLHQLHDFDGCRQINETVFADAITIIESRELDELIVYKNAMGKEFSNSILEILFHSVNHATHHKGQVISDFRSSGIAPIVTDYIFYKREQQAGVRIPHK